MASDDDDLSTFSVEVGQRQQRRRQRVALLRDGLERRFGERDHACGRVLDGLLRVRLRFERRIAA